MVNFLQAGAILLILSFMVERATNFIKSRFEFLFAKADSKSEKKREWRIQYVAVGFGLLVGIVLKANIFLLFRKDFHLFWNADLIADETLTSDLIGSALCGLFLSFASKFLHDLFDLLHHAKYHKRIQLEQIKEQSRITLMVKRKEIEEASKISIQAISAVQGVTSAILEFGDKPVLNVHVETAFNKNQVLPIKLPYTLSTGDSGLIDVKITEGFDPQTHSTVYPGSGIKNVVPYVGNIGSMGGVLYDTITNEPFLVTCYHVVKSPTHDWDNFLPDGHESISDTNDNPVGTIVRAIRDESIDGALVRHGDGIAFDGSINGIGLIVVSRRMNFGDKVYATKVKMYGHVSKLSVGYVIDLEKVVSISYVDGSKHTLSDLIVVRAYQQETFSQGGDSGSFVVDEYNYLVGVLVGGNKDISFIIPIDNINTGLKTKISIA